jgi:hypothetical protein
MKISAFTLIINQIISEKNIKKIFKDTKKQKSIHILKAEKIL